MKRQAGKSGSTVHVLPSTLNIFWNAHSERSYKCTSNHRNCFEWGDILLLVKEVCV